ncbi:hypothetical protein EWM64_g21 [Hericium alpestre]|uniref:Peptidase A1 domain-containing protein n=1 Tax=Hericium alpestre TaxID=135208 RepID=A0A4Z0AA82_9AGAM|nr:hypothetical protein EWM64_g21 [Hericium alpestre]
MQSKQTFTKLLEAVIVAVSLSADIHAIPTHALDSQLDVRQVWQNETNHNSSEAVNILPRVNTVNVPLQAYQIEGQDAYYVAGFRGHRPGYHAGQSTSFQNLHQAWQIQYADGSRASGDVARDRVRIGNMAMAGFPIGMADTLTGNLRTSRDSGVAGFANGRRAATRTGGPAVLDALRDTGYIELSMVGIKLGRGAHGAAGTGRLTLGGYDATLFHGGNDMVTVHNTHAGGLWQVTLPSIRVGGTTVAHGTGILDTGAARITTSPHDAEAVHARIPGAAYTQGVFGLPCNTHAVVSFRIGNIRWGVNSRDLVGPAINNQGTVCLSQIQALGNKPVGTWTLGIPFLKNVYQILDSDNNDISLARLA